MVVPLLLLLVLVRKGGDGRWSSKLWLNCGRKGCDDGKGVKAVMMVVVVRGRRRRQRKLGVMVMVVEEREGRKCASRASSLLY